MGKTGGARHGDAPAVGVEGTFWIEIEVIRPGKTCPLIDDAKHEVLRVALQGNQGLPVAILRQRQTTANFLFPAALPFELGFFFVADTQITVFNGIDHQFRKPRRDPVRLRAKRSEHGDEGGNIGQAGKAVLRVDQEFLHFSLAAFQARRMFAQRGACGAIIERGMDDGKQGCRRARFGQVVMRPRREPLAHFFWRVGGGLHDDRQFGMTGIGVQTLEKGQPIQPGHVAVENEQGKIAVRRAQALPCLFGIGKLFQTKAFRQETLLGQKQADGLIVDEQNSFFVHAKSRTERRQTSLVLALVLGFQHPSMSSRLIRINGREYELAILETSHFCLTPMPALPDLICPAGSLPALKTAVDHGADAVYLGFKNDTNARNFAGLNFDQKSMVEGIRYAHAKGREILLAINTFAQAGRVMDWQKSIDAAVDLGVDAIILADVGLLAYAANKYPQQRLHLSVQGSATSYEAINFCQREFGVRRAVLPRVLTLAQVEHVIKNTTVEIEIFGFGSLCVMNEGRCWLSSYACGESPNTVGACSPAKYVKWDKQPGVMETRLNGILIDRFNDDEPAGYPTLCKGRFDVQGETYYALEEPTSLNVLEILPEILNIGVRAIKVEGRQRSPAYVAQVTRTLRAALDSLRDAHERYHVKPAWQAELAKVSEGNQATLGAYNRPWR